MVTHEDLAQSVAEGVRIANTSTSGGRAMAQVLLSAYNGDHYHLDVTDLCLFDNGTYRHVLNIFELRRRGIEPHRLVPDGQATFDALERKWVDYHTWVRYQKFHGMDKQLLRNLK